MTNGQMEGQQENKIPLSKVGDKKSHTNLPKNLNYPFVPKTKELLKKELALQGFLNNVTFHYF